MTEVTPITIIGGDAIPGGHVVHEMNAAIVPRAGLTLGTGKSWTCAECTNYNPPVNVRCGACNLPRPADAAPTHMAHDLNEPVVLNAVVPITPGSSPRYHQPGNAWGESGTPRSPVRAQAVSGSRNAWGQEPEPLEPMAPSLAPPPPAPRTTLYDSSEDSSGMRCLRCMLCHRYQQVLITREKIVEDRYGRCLGVRICCCAPVKTSQMDLNFVDDIELRRHVCLKLCCDKMCCSRGLDPGNIRVYTQGSTLDVEVNLHSDKEGRRYFDLNSMAQSKDVFTELSDLLCAGDFRAFKMAAGPHEF